MDRFIAKEDEQKVAWIKRFMEYETLIPGFHEEEGKDPEGVLKKYGFPLTLEEISFYPGKIENHYVMDPVYPETAAKSYTEFIKNKLAFRDELKVDNIPANEAMRKWHKRQTGRCIAELGARCDSLVQVPFTVELADGCSVGCEFCGLNAGRLKSVFRYTEENAKLFNDVLIGAKELIGDACKNGTLYFASEPLDNPDYESFMHDFVKILGRYPQITTATALKHKELLHKILPEMNETGNSIYRFSVLSEDIAHKIFAEFTPEELLYTELLPQFEEAPTAGFVDSGRRGEADNNLEGTISCVSGFIVNFARKTVRLTSPTQACKEHPTGEIIFETAEFTDAADCIEVMKGMIRKYMLNVIAPKDRVRLREGLTWKLEDEKLVVDSGKGTTFTISVAGDISFYEDMMKALSSGYHTKREVVSKLLKRFEGKLVRTEMLHYAINRIWELGILELESGKV